MFINVLYRLMLTIEQQIKIRDLNGFEISPREIARRLNISVGSVYKYIKKDPAEFANRRLHNLDVSPKLQPFIQHLESRIRRDEALPAAKLYLEIKRAGYKGSYPLVNNFIKRILGIRKVEKHKK